MSLYIWKSLQTHLSLGLIVCFLPSVFSLTERQKARVLSQPNEEPRYVTIGGNLIPVSLVYVKECVWYVCSCMLHVHVNVHDMIDMYRHSGSCSRWV